ncbi:MAG: hypothetical protein ACW7DS_18430, partial [Paraglaciecola chathamensis]
MSNKWFSVLFLGFIAIGVFFGVRLSAVDNLETFKVLNVIGLFYDIVGLLILSEIFSENQSYQKFVADTFSGLFMWAHMGIPIGILLSGIGLTYFSGYPSSE